MDVVTSGHGTRARIARFLKVIVGIVLFVSAIGLLAQDLVPVPRWFVRRMIVGFLSAVLVLQIAILIVAPIASLLLGMLVYRARRQHGSTLWTARPLLLAVSCLVGFGLLEAGAVAQRAWTHRYPALPTRFPENDQSRAGSTERGSIHILVIGESTALGQPYDAWLSVGAIVGWKLAGVFPGRRVSVDVWARKGANLEQMRLRLATLRRRPDAVLIYSGHNEFQSVFPWGRVVPHYLDESQPASLTSRLERFGRVTNLGRLICDTIESQRLDTAPSPKVTRSLVDVPSYTHDEAAQLLARYHDHLHAITAYCNRIGAVPILVVPAGNDAGYEPNRSVLAPETSRSKREEFARQFQYARRMEAVDPSRSLALYRSLADQQPGFAETHYRLARMLERSGDWSGASRHFTLARDLDGMVQRCTTPFQDACREVGEKHHCVLIDGPSVLSKLVPDGILDDRLFHDAHHPTLFAYITLAQEVLNGLRARRAFGWPVEIDVPVIDPDDCATQFKVGTAAWATVLEHSSVWYRASAYFRHDPSDRLARSRQLAEAARRIALGTSPEATGVPGLGSRPTLTFPAQD